MPELKQFLFHLVQKGFILLVITVSFDALSAPAQSCAQDYPVSVVETGKTPGFTSPVLFLNTRIAARRLLSKLAHYRTLHETYLINQDEDCGEKLAYQSIS
jgi:hypothetical protein